MTEPVLTAAALPASADVAVIGAGTMGAGIALVAARAGHLVRLHDAAPGAAERGIAGIVAILDRDLAKGRITGVERDQVLGRVVAAPAIEELAPSSLVIEAIIENLDIKAAVLGRIEEILRTDAILATNTSSLSVTALAARMRRPDRVAGLHFFNPAPVLPLVEVVSGHATDPIVAETLFATALAWGKVPVRCGSTPGFIVNRVARPFYGEALRLLSERAATPETIDAVMRECGGFRMGPFALMDLIGHDVNFAVTRSVFDATFGDARYRPSLTQQSLVEAGWFGRKTGQGFFDYRDGAAPRAPENAPPAPRPHEVLLPPDLGPAAALAVLLREAGFETGTTDQPGAMLVDGTLVALTDGRTATERAVEAGRPVALFDLALDYRVASRIAVAVSDGAPAASRDAAVGLFNALGKAVSLVDDAPGLVVARTVAMLANEAADALGAGIASARDIDLSMVKGVNYPQGPLAWAEQAGPAFLAQFVGNLAAFYGEERYRLCPLLRCRAASGRWFLDG